MKIALLHYASHPIIGGVENVVRQHSRLMAEAGHSVRVIAGRGAQVDAEVEFVPLALADSQAAEVLALKRELDAGQVPASFHQVVSQIELQLSQALAETDWIFAHNVCSLNKNLALTAALHRISNTRDKPRFALWHHDLAWTTPRYAAEMHGGYPWDLLRTDWPEVVQVTVSKSRRKELAELLGSPEKRILVIPNGIDVESFLGLGEETKGLVREFQLLDAAPLVLLPARITPRKNIEMGLRIAAQLREQHPRTRLLITGPAGPHNAANAKYVDSLLAMHRELGLHGSALFLTLAAGKPITDEVVKDLYRLADLLLLPSTEEGFGIPLLEAGLAGLPVFCSDLGPLQEVGAEDVRYFSAEAEAAEIAQDILRELDANPRFRFRKRILKEFAWPRIYADHLAPLLEGMRG